MLTFQKLSRLEMKNVLGGVVAPPSGPCKWSGTCTNFPSTQYTQGADAAQDAADGWCAAADCCTDVDCPGATGD